MQLKKYLSIFLIGIAFAVAGCSGDSNSGVNKEPIDDIDGDGIADIVDPDIDGDGIPNEQDPDDDNDGVEDSIDPTPPVKPGTKTCTAAQILPPEGGPGKHQLGDIGELGWKLLPEGCVLPLARDAGQGVPVSATKVDDGKFSDATAKAGNCDGRTPEQVQCGVDIEIPKGCGPKGEARVTFDITEIGLALGDTTLSKGVYTQTNGYEKPKCVTSNFNVHLVSDFNQATYEIDDSGNAVVDTNKAKGFLWLRNTGNQSSWLEEFKKPVFATDTGDLAYVQVNIVDMDIEAFLLVTVKQDGKICVDRKSEGFACAESFSTWRDLTDKYGWYRLEPVFLCDLCPRKTFRLNLDKGHIHTVSKFRIIKNQPE